MDFKNTQHLYKETRLSLEPSSAASVVNIRVPPPLPNSKSDARKPKSSDNAATEEESAFRHKNLATASSIFHRKHHGSPRSFLWRLLEGNTVLSIRVADVSRPEKEADSTMILNFRFSATLRPACVAFADPKEHDALVMFVLDDGNHLYSFTLRPDYFRKRMAIEQSPGEACKVYLPSVFSFKHPHRMVASAADQVVVALHDGGLVRLDRNKAHTGTGSPWKETIYNSQSWTQGLRSLIPFQGKSPIWQGKVNMDLSAATSIQVTDLGLEGASFLFTVCLDHRMRIWNLHTGQILFTGDILNADRTAQETGKWIIDPTHSNLLQLVGDTVGARICATYSPVGSGQFKLWTIKAHDADTIYVEDSFPDVSLIPASPSLSDVWTLADFALCRSAEGTVQLWALWKNNMTYRAQELDLDRDHMAQCWESDWASVVTDSVAEPAQTSGPYDPTDVTDKWLKLILSPGRFTRATLETALLIYEKGLGGSQQARSQLQKGLAESICLVIASTVSLDRKSSGSMEFEQFRASTEIHWRRFHRLLLELDKQRGEAVSLALDPQTGLACVVCSDYLSAIRECSGLERLYYNLSRPEDGLGQAANLISTGLTFLEAFPDSTIQVCIAALRAELFEETPRTDYQRLQYMWDKTAFWRSISEEDCSQVTDTLGQNFEVADTDVYGQIFQLLSIDAATRSRGASQPLTDIGRRVIVKAAQETVDLWWKICLSQLLLLVHMEFDWDQEEDMLHKRLDVGAVFRRYLEGLRRLELIRWLANTQISIAPSQKAERSGSLSGLSPIDNRKKQEDDNQTATTLEATIGHLFGFGDPRTEPLPRSITDVVVGLCAADSDIEVPPTMIQCALVRRERADLALQLTPFCDQTPFAVYIQGRVALALRDCTSAALSFRRAAVGMSVQDRSGDRHSSGLLDDTEWNLLHSGPARYYCHIVALFERAKAYSYVIDFAGLAIQFSHASPEAATIKTEMLSRQFNAAAVTSRFDVAHSSLLAMKDKAMQHSSLRQLIDKMCESYHNKDLMTLPFPGLEYEIEDILERRCQSITDVLNGTPYHQILYSWRIGHNNYRGAAAVLLDRIQKLKQAGEGDKFIGEDVLDTPVTKQYLLLINVLSCLETDEAWIITEEPVVTLPASSNPQGGADAKKKGVLVTLADLRKQYQDELDRIAAIQNNQFGFEADDEAMDIL